MKNSKKILALCVLISLSAAVFGVPDFKIINPPTGLVLGNSEFYSQLQFEASGDLRLEVDIGFFEIFEIGASFLIGGLIGNDTISLDVPRPYVAVQLVNPKMGLPFYMKIGWDGKDPLPAYPLDDSQRGLFLSFTKYFKDNAKEYGSATLGFHSPFIADNYIGFYFCGNFYLTKLFTVNLILDDFFGVFLNDGQPFKNAEFLQGGPGVQINLNRMWSMGFQFLFDNNGAFYRYFYVTFNRWL